MILSGWSSWGVSGLRKRLSDGVFLEKGEAQHLSDGVAAGFEMKRFFQDGHEQINGDGRPDLRAHGVWARAVKGFDAEMLLAPFEKRFDLPATLIQLRAGQRWHGEVVGQKDQGFSGFQIAIADAPQRGGISLSGLQSGRDDRLVKAPAGGFIHRLRVAPDETEVFLGTRDEEGGTPVQAMQPGEVQIAAIHEVERTGLPTELVEDIDIMNPARRDNHDHDGGKVAVGG